MITKKKSHNTLLLGVCVGTDDFEDFCLRASKLADESEGAPLFTVSQMAKKPSKAGCGDVCDSIDTPQSDSVVGEEDNSHEDDWQLL